jgi:hypothetical protein
MHFLTPGDLHSSYFNKLGFDSLFAKFCNSLHLIPCRQSLTYKRISKFLFFQNQFAFKTLNVKQIKTSEILQSVMQSFIKLTPTKISLTKERNLENERKIIKFD